MSHFSLLLGLTLAYLSSSATPLDQGTGPPAPTAVTVTFRFEPVAKLPGPITGVVTLWPEGQPEAKRELAVEAGKVAPVALSAGKTWEGRREVPGAWSFGFGLNLRSDEAERQHVVKLWPTTRVSGMVKREHPREQLPTELELKLSPPPYVPVDAGRPAGKFPCPVTKERAFSCEEPADLVDLAVRARGFIPHYRWGQKLEPGKELKLGTLLLRPGASLDGWGQPWWVGMEPEHSAAHPLESTGVFQGTTSPEGTLEIPDRAPGWYRLRIKDSAGSQFHFDMDPVLLDTATAERAISLEVIRLEGRARLGDRPLVGQVWFGGKNGAQRSLAETDEEGAFLTLLPKAGKWLVEAQPADGKLLPRLVVDIEAGENGRAETVLRWGKTRLLGRVVDGKGQGVGGADVHLAMAFIPQNTRTDTSGAFTFEGLSGEAVRLTAERRHRGQRAYSDPQTVPLGDAEEVGPITLTLKQAHALRGRVEAGGVPLVGARLSFFPLEPAGAPGNDRALTGLDGSFEVFLSAGVRQARALIEAAGLPLQALSMTVGPDPVTLRPEAAAGTLVVSLWPEEAAEKPYQVAIWQNGTEIKEWEITEHLKRRHLPVPTGYAAPLEALGLAAGHYRIRMTRWQGQETMAKPAPPSTGCDTGTLTAGGTLVLRPGR